MCALDIDPLADAKLRKLLTSYTTKPDARLPFTTPVLRKISCQGPEALSSMRETGCPLPPQRRVSLYIPRRFLLSLRLEPARPAKGGIPSFEAPHPGDRDELPGVPGHPYDGWNGGPPDPVTDVMRSFLISWAFVLNCIPGAVMSSDTTPSTRHRNRLAGEKSPYLLQHAGNPVDWYRWGEEAFELARREDRPIFLSIGYATCHWCHVMERESFEDPEVAALLNEHFVAIKVDREERPDIDQVYMTVCQMLTGSGGWPLTIVMTPDRKPFFAGTYFPKHGRFNRPGMMELLPRIAEMWRSRREELEASASEITSHLLRSTSNQTMGRAVDATTLDEAYRQLSARFDRKHGGFGTRPKFPTPHNLTFLLRQHHRTGTIHAREMVIQTLRAMGRGGIRDHLGGGFHRYSTDERWLVPHYEKMLYDQAGLVGAYLEAFQAVGDEDLADTAREILAYVGRDMVGPGGAFLSAEDADSDGMEGKFYLWTLDEMKALLEPAELRVAVVTWNVEAEGNWADEITGFSDGTNILHRTATDEDLAGEFELCPTRFRELLESARGKLFEARTQRVRPLLDDKVLTDWNGLMIAAFARASTVLGDPKLAHTASRAADFVLKNLRDRRGSLLHRWRDGEAGIPAMLEDHAFLALGLLELHQATQDPRWLRRSLMLAQEALLCYGARDGGLYRTASDAEALLVRPRESHDGALPSGVSVMADVLLRLSRLTGREDLEQKAATLVTAVAAAVSRSPAGHTALLGALQSLHDRTFEIVLVGDPASENTARMLETIRASYLPGSVVLLVPPGPEGETVRELAPHSRELPAIEGRPTAYVCRNFACELPVTDPGALERSFAAARPPE